MESNLITPICSAKYIWLFTPNVKFGSVYSVSCIMDGSPEWTTLISRIQKEYDEYYAAQCVLLKNKKLKKCQYLPWKHEESTGQDLFVAKNNSEGTKKDGTKFTVKPTVYGPDLQRLSEDELKGALGTGTMLRVGFAVNRWTNDAQGVGVSARLKFAQIIEPRYFSGYDGFEGPDGSGLKPYDRSPTLFNVPSRESRETKKPILPIRDGGIEDLFDRAAGEDLGY